MYNIKVKEIGQRRGFLMGLGEVDYLAAEMITDEGNSLRRLDTFPIAIVFSECSGRPVARCACDRCTGRIHDNSYGWYGYQGCLSRWDSPYDTSEETRSEEVLRFALEAYLAEILATS